LYISEKYFREIFFLPYFDYYRSLIIYFPSTAYQSLSNCFNLCLFKLFNFKPEYDSEEDDEERIMSDFLVMKIIGKKAKKKISSSAGLARPKSAEAGPSRLVGLLTSLKMNTILF
jgi:hypothetical protein